MEIDCDVAVPHTYELQFQFAFFPRFEANADDVKIVQLIGRAITNFVKTG